MRLCCNFLLSHFLEIVTPAKSTPQGVLNATLESWYYQILLEAVVKVVVVVVVDVILGRDHILRQMLALLLAV